MDIFTNREIATIFWLAFVIIIALSYKKARISGYRIIKTILNKKILIPIFLYLCYFSSFLLVLYHFKLWDIKYLKDAIIWFIFSGLQMGYLAGTKKSSRLESGFWKHQILDNLKIVAFFEFYVNLFSFSLIYELLFIPIISLMVWLNIIAEHRKLDNVKKTITTPILTFFGSVILLYSLYRTINEIDSIANVDTLKYFLFPVAYSIISIFFVYFFILYIEYELLYIRIKMGNKRSEKLNLKILFRLFLFCNIQINKLKIAANMGNYNLMSISSEKEIEVMIRRYKEILAQEKLHKGN